MLFRVNVIDPDHCVLVLVDYQQKLMPAIHRGAEVVAEAVRLADVAHELGLRVIGTEQNPQGLGPNVAEIRARCDTTLGKSHFDGCGDGLAEALRPLGDGQLLDVVIAGCEAHVCLMQTTLGLLRAGFRAWVVANACSSRSPVDHELAMERLRQAGAVLVSAEMVIFEWMRTCEHERFKPVLERLKAK